MFHINVISVYECNLFKNYQLFKYYNETGAVSEKIENKIVPNRNVIIFIL